MSLLRTSVVMPNRLMAIFHYLLWKSDHKEDRVRLEALLSPSALKSDVNKFFPEALREGIKLQLFAALPTGEIALPEQVLQLYKLTKLDLTAFRVLLSDLIFNSGDDNADMCRSLAWFLSQDPMDFDITERNLDAGMSALPAELLDIRNSTRFLDFIHWSRFLGFGWEAPNRILVPDPTCYLKAVLPQLFDGVGRHSFSAVREKLIGIAPVFEGGRFFEMISTYLPVKPARQLSGAESAAWLRLDDVGLIRLIAGADAADSYVLTDGNSTQRVSHVQFPVAN